MYQYIKFPILFTTFLQKGPLRTSSNPFSFLEGFLDYSQLRRRPPSSQPGYIFPRRVSRMKFSNAFRACSGRPVSM